MTDFAARVTKLRACSGLSLEQAAYAMRMARSTLWRIETGRTAPTIDSLQALSDHYGVSIAFLAGEDGGEDQTLRRLYRRIADLDERDRGIVDDLVKAMRRRR